MKRFLVMVPILLLSGLLLLFVKGLALNPKELPSALLQKPVPVFTLPRLDNLSKVVTEQDFKNKVTVVHFWATWCHACRRELPLLMKIAADKKIQLISVNYRDQVADAQFWLNSYGDPYEYTIFDPNGDLGFRLGLYGTPETFVIDKKGLIQLRLSGPLSEKIYQEVVLRLVGELNDL